MKTLVLGASPKSERYSNKAVLRLQQLGHEVVAVGLRKSDINGIAILEGMPEVEGVDTVTMYLGAKNQKMYYSYILSLKPKRVLFNPGAENPELVAILKEAGITYENACTLVLLATNQY